MPLSPQEECTIRATMIHVVCYKLSVERDGVRQLQSGLYLEGMALSTSWVIVRYPQGDATAVSDNRTASLFMAFPSHTL